MGWIVWTIVAGALAGACLVGRHLFKKYAANEDNTRQDRRDAEIAAKVSTVIWAVFFGIWLLSTGYVMVATVGSGEAGIVYQFDKIVGQRSAGVNLVLPWQEVSTVNVKTQHYTFTDTDCSHDDGCHVKDMLRAASKDTQDVFVVGTLNFALSEAKVQDLYATVGPNWFDTLVKPRVLNAVKEQTVKYPAQDILANREAIRTDTIATLKGELEPYSITVVDFLVENIDFSPEFKQAIEAKQAAEQAALQAKNEATKAINAATGEAESTRLKGEAQAKANASIAASITPALIEYQKALALANWPVATYIPGGADGVLVSP
jgi:prohibitin 2